MFPILAIVAAAAWLQAPPAPAPTLTLTADLDGQEARQTATAVVAGGKVRLEIRDAGGKLLAQEAVPSASQANPRVELALGALGSAGALVEADVAGPVAECRTLWRFRDGRLSRVPILGASGPHPDCGPPEWKSRWERPAADAPAIFLRERTRQRSNGLFREVEGYRYAGFRMALDPGRSSSWINGVEIPAWRETTLYPRALLDRLVERFDLSPFQTQPRARLFADREQGIFELRLEDQSQQRNLPITAAVPGPNDRERLLTVGTEGARVQVFVSADGAVPVEARVQGLGRGFDLVYVPVTRQRESNARVYGSAEQEVAEDFLPATWDNGKEQVAVTFLSASPLRLRFGTSEVSLSISQAPRGVDVLVVPRDGSPPSQGLLLRGQDAFVTVPVRCAPAAQTGAWRCEPGEPGLTMRRVGARLNVH